MPQIREYENKINALSPNETGVNAVARAAQSAAQAGGQQAAVTERAGGLRQAVGSLLDREGRAIGGAVDATFKGGAEIYRQQVEQPEIAKLSTLAVKKLDDVTAAWTETARNAPLNDSEVGSKFKEQVLQPMLDDFQGLASTEAGRQHAQAISDKIAAHMSEKIGADQITRAGQAIKSNLNTITNQLSDTAAKDPHAFETTIEMARMATQALIQSTPGIDAGTAAKIEGEHLDHVGKQIAQATIVGLVRTNPDEAERQIQSGRFKQFIDGAHEMQYVKQAQAAAKMQANADRIEQQRAQKEAVEKAATKILVDNTKFDANGFMQIGPEYFKQALELTKLPGADHHLVFSMISAGRSAMRDQERQILAKDDPATYSHFLDRLASDDDKPSLAEVNMMQGTGQLSAKSAAFFRRAVTQKDPEEMKDTRALKEQIFAKYQGYISKSNLMTKDAQGDQRLAEFKQFMVDQFEQQKKAGKSRADIIASLDTVARESLPKFQVTMDQSIQGVQQRATGVAQPMPNADTKSGPAPRMQGESAAAYLARTSK